MQTAIITLAEHELRQAVDVAVRRQLTAWGMELRPVHGQQKRGDHWQNQITGAMGELAVAKFFGYYWHTPTLNETDGIPPDVGPLEARATEWHPAHLYVHDYDRHAPYVLAIVKRNRVKLAGWAYKDDVKHGGEYCPTDTHPTWRLHQDHLRPISDLLTITKQEGNPTCHST